jgi:hypothetical protein
MKQRIYILGIVTVLIIFAGTVFKVSHWPFAGLMITTGLLTLVLVFLPVALIDHYKATGTRENLLLHIVTWLTCFVVFSGILFKIMHWPFANTILTLALM